MSAAPGWYPDPSPAHPGVPSVRWWDGRTWTEHVGPVVDGRPVTTVEPQKVEWLALVLALLPLIGIVGGIISMAKGKTLTGGLMLAIGCASALVLSLVRAA